MFTPRPAWQKLLDLLPNLNGSKFDGRAVPDIASNADPRSGMITPGPDGDQAIGGTSLAAPTDAVKAAKISMGSGKTTGYWNPEIYDMAAKHPEAFHDIVSGRNTDGGVKGYPAGKGYDMETGNGSIDVAKYIAARSAMLNQTPLTRNLALGRTFVTSGSSMHAAYGLNFQPGTVTSDNNENILKATLLPKF
jgi:subtilase family serine protease